MKEVLQFMGVHPWLTVFLALIGVGLVNVILTGIGYIVRGSKETYMS